MLERPFEILGDSMENYEGLIDALINMSGLYRPLDDPKDNPYVKKQKRIQHGICDLMEDAAVALDALSKKVKENENRETLQAA